MVLSWKAFVRGMAALSARCQVCGSNRVRPSKEKYEGSLARVFDLTPWRCRDCLRHFALPPRLHRTPGAVSSEEGLPIDAARMHRKRVCPKCHRREARMSGQQPLDLWARLTRRTAYRCEGCDRRFEVIHLGRLMADVLVTAALVGMVIVGVSELVDSWGVMHGKAGRHKGSAQQHR